MSVKVALAGIGNCVSSLVQGVEYYRDAADDAQVPGLMHVRLGKYHVSDLDFVAAFDVDAKKVGLDLSEAIWAGHNNTIKFSDVQEIGIKVDRGPTLDGFGAYYQAVSSESEAAVVDVVQVLRDSGAEVLAETKGPKIRIFKYKNKTGYRRRQGHRQRYTQVKVTGIES